jgi:uncharacterized protein (TIGR03643 family)
MSAKHTFTQQEIDRIIQMAWEDRTPFEAITLQFGLNHNETIAFMRKHMKSSSFRMWRKRMNGRATKQRSIRELNQPRFRCARQSDYY